MATKKGETAARPRGPRNWNPRSWLTEKLVATLLVLFLLVYVVYQALSYLHSPVKTETVYEYSVANSLSASCVVIRDELVVPAEGAQGVESYLYDDGERVLVGATIVEYYASETGSSERRQLQQTRQEIAMLSEAQNTAVNHVSNAEALGREIKQGLGRLVQMSATGEFDSLGALRPEMVSLLNKRQIATGKETGYQDRIDMLESQYLQLTSHTQSNTLASVSAPRSGYFAHTVDGYENLITSELLGRNANAQDLMDLIERVGESPSPGGAGAARIVTDQNWYVAAVVDKFDIQWARVGQSVEMQFEDAVSPITGSIHSILTENNRDEAVLIITSNIVNGETLSLRGGQVTLNFSVHRGLRVSTAYLHFDEEGRRGVYVLDNRIVRFKVVDAIYEEQGFLLSRQPTNPYDTTTVKQYDQIVIKGTDLYDGKIVE